MSLILREALKNESSISTAQDALVKEGFDRASETFVRWHPSLYSYKVYSESCQRRLRTNSVLERLNLECKRRTKKIY